jgi:hypothetical protein
VVRSQLPLGNVVVRLRAMVLETSWGRVGLDDGGISYIYTRRASLNSRWKRQWHLLHNEWGANLAGLATIQVFENLLRHCIVRTVLNFSITLRTNSMIVVAGCS